MFCTNCGTPKKPEGKFCGNCGVSFDESYGAEPNATSSANPIATPSMNHVATPSTNPATNNRVRNYEAVERHISRSDMMRTPLKRRRNSNALIGVLVALAVVVIVVILLYTLLSPLGHNGLVGTWELQTPGSPDDANRTVFDFAKDSFTATTYSHYDGSLVNSTEGAYTTSGSEITMIVDGRANTVQFQFVGDSLVIDGRTFNRVSGRQVLSPAQTPTTPSIPIADAPQIAPSLAGSGSGPATGEPVSLNEAMQTSGVYIKDSNHFYRINTIHLAPNLRFGYPANGIVNHYEIPRITGDKQLVIIGTDINIDQLYALRVVNTGYTFDYYAGISYNPSPGVDVGFFLHGHRNPADERMYVTINGDSPANFESRMISGVSGLQFSVFDASLMESFILGGFDGTEWIETEYIANQRYIITEEMSYDTMNGISIERTRDGYFIITLGEGLNGVFVIQYPREGVDFFVIVDLS